MASLGGAISGAINDLLSPNVRPFTSFNFQVEIEVDGVSNEICAAVFSDVDGLEMTLEPKTIREGGRNTGPIHMAGQVMYGQLTLKRGMTSNFDLWKWFEQTASPGQGGLRGSAEIVMIGSDGSEQVRFLLSGCLPVKLKAPALNAKDGLIAIEEMALVYESLTLKAPGLDVLGITASLLS
jgi:phage tail-like protein